ncbi:MAG: hypothetical protein U0T83_04755 [Bacteriovoracaceae bacterium]
MGHQVYAEEELVNDSVPYYYKDQKQSLVKWDELDPIEWLDLDYWKRIRAIKDSIPDWKVKQRDLFNSEIFGRVLSCVGFCKIYRGSGFANASFNSVIREGDEIQTMKNSYMWLFMPDGTLIRISPQTSISLKEFNVATDQFFTQVRLNFGNILWLSRFMETYQESNLKETDALFLPMRVMEANAEVEKRIFKENELEKYLEESEMTLHQFKKLNSLISKNNENIFYKKTYAYIILPNATIQGRDLMMEIYYSAGHNSYFKQRKISDFLQSDSVNDAITVQLRGYQDEELQNIREGAWYQVDPMGKNLTEKADFNRLFAFGELVTKRIPTILIARELWLSTYNSFFFMQKNVDEKNLAVDYGYRLWNEKDKSEISERIKYLNRYVKRIETGNLRALSKLKERLVHSEEENIETFIDRFYDQSLARYVGQLSVGESDLSEKDKKLNSTKHPFWKYLHLSGNP